MERDHWKQKSHTWRTTVVRGRPNEPTPILPILSFLFDCRHWHVGIVQCSETKFGSNTYRTCKYGIGYGRTYSHPIVPYSICLTQGWLFIPETQHIPKSLAPYTNYPLTRGHAWSKTICVWRDPLKTNNSPYQMHTGFNKHVEFGRWEKRNCALDLNNLTKAGPIRPVSAGILHRILDHRIKCLALSCNTTWLYIYNKSDRP